MKKLQNFQLTGFIDMKISISYGKIYKFSAKPILDLKNIK